MKSLYVVIFPLVMVFGMMQKVAAQLNVIADLSLEAISLGDTLTLGCEVPINYTLKNNSDITLVLHDYFINVNISTNDIPADLSLVDEITFSNNLSGQVLLPNETKTISRSMPINTNFFAYGSNGLAQKNVVITWGTGAYLEDPNEDNNYLAKEVFVSADTYFESDSVTVTYPLEESEISVSDLPVEVVYAFEDFAPTDEIDLAFLKQYNDFYVLALLSNEGMWYFFDTDGIFLYQNENGEDDDFLIPPNILVFLSNIGGNFSPMAKLVLTTENYPLVEVRKNGPGPQNYLYFDLYGNFININANQQPISYQEYANSIYYTPPIFPYIQIFVQDIFPGANIENIECSCGYGIESVNGLAIYLDNNKILHIYNDDFEDSYYIEDLEDNIQINQTQANVPQNFINDLVMEGFSAEELTFLLTNYLNCSLELTAYVASEVVATYDYTAMETNIVAALDNTQLSIKTLEMYPNPAFDNVCIKNNDTQKISIEIFNAQMQSIICLNIAPNDLYKLDINAWKTGVYFVNIQQENKKAILRKIIKM
ncbi:MAG: T9SS type A sorting domain-containing protein [Chitinophagales bacterium]|nr:T9SS type A sorting domain-containing protein [Bacteroidota bacterium]MCB9043057.1 T9SS type A sorting domain-containing protein [Chitinophagales bacterium]